MTTAGYRENNSPGKIAARSNAYAHLSRQDLYTKMHVVIASEDCGDIQHLLFMGVSAKKIIACDLNPKAREAAKAFGVIVSPHGSIQETTMWAFKKYGRKIASVNVDLCMSVIGGAPILKEVLDNMRASLGGKSSQVAVMFTYLRARDGMNDSIFNRKRLNYVSNEIGHNLNDSFNGCSLNDKGFNYKSFTRKSVGSPMSMIAFQPFRTYHQS